jgi:hypothetical protein
MADLIIEFIGRLIVEVIWNGFWRLAALIWRGGTGLVALVVAAVTSKRSELPPAVTPPPTDDQTGSQL